ncbi:glycoside hydrolase family 3 C-terminal domain-containing protein [Jatrophihabitans fulvus]
MTRRHWRHRRPVAALATMLVAAGTLGAAVQSETAAAAAPATPAYLNRSLDPGARAADLVARMSLTEKAQQMNSSRAPAIPRLGIAAWGWWNEANHGINASTLTPTGNATTLTNTTSYPSDLSLGSTWNPSLVYREAGLIGDEARDTAPNNTQNLDFYAPTVNLSRDPRWGRNDESWSEDPTLTALLAGQYVNGLQGQTMKGVLPKSAKGYYKAIATLKHYAANNSEVNRRSGSSDMDQRTLREYYTKQFADIIRSSSPGSIMSAYNEVNGTPAAADPYLNSDLARQTFGFKGYFTSDCDAVREIQAGHQWTPPNASAPVDQYGRTAYAISAGEDLDCNAGYHDQYDYGNTVPTALGQKIKTLVDTFNIGDVDTSVTRLFTARIETGEFDNENQVPWVKAARQRLGGTEWTSNASNNAITETPERLAQAKKSADESLVLLQNTKKALPLKVPSSGDYKVAVVGYFAHPQSLYLGGYSAFQQGAGAANNVDVYTGIKNAIAKRNPSATVDFLPGVTGGTTAGSLTTVDADTIAKVKGYDAVVVVAGTDFTTSREDVDRSSLALPGAQAQMISQVGRANPNTVAYLETTGPVETGAFAGDVRGLVWSSYNGQKQGDAFADALLGTTTPSGHLPFTWYRDTAQLPSILDYAIRPAGHNPGRTYMYFTGQSSYPFGYGLSYAKFQYSPLTVSSKKVDAEGTVTVTTTVTNRSDVAGAAVPQLYATTPFAKAAQQRPAKRLMTFAKVALKAGQSKKVTLTFPASQLAFFDEKKAVMKVDTGSYGLQLAQSATDVSRTAKVAVSGSLGKAPTVLDAKPVQKGDKAADVQQRVVFDRDTTIDPQLTVSTDDEKLHGYVRRGLSTELPANLKVTYSSSDSKVVKVTKAGALRTVGSGVATVTVDATWRGHTVTTSFPVNVAPLHITSAPTLSVPAGQPATFTVTADTTASPTAAELPRIRFAGPLPSGMKAVDNGDGTATISGTPRTAGTYPVRITAVNNVSPTTSQTLTITVT